MRLLLFLLIAAGLAGCAVHPGSESDRAPHQDSDPDPSLGDPAPGAEPDCVRWRLDPDICDRVIQESSRGCGEWFYTERCVRLTWMTQ